MSHTGLGECLRRAREAIPASLLQAARETRIRLDYLEAMERGQFGFVSGEVYVRGMLLAYARWLGLDAAQVAAAFDRLSEPPCDPPLSRRLIPRPVEIQRPHRPRWTFLAAGALSFLLIFWLAGLVKPARVARPPAPPSAASVDTPKAGSTTSSPQFAQAPAPPPPSVRADGVRLVVRVVEERCWMLVTADGRKVFEGSVPAGQSRTFEAKELLKVTFGNLGAVRLQLNGKDLGTPGGFGQTGTFPFRPDTTTLSRA